MTGQAGWTRRATLLGAMAAGFKASRAATSSPRVAALDWGWAATLVAIGVDPVGVAERRAYGAWVGEPALPPTTAELGSRTMPGLETLVALRPDLILTNSLNAALRPQLERIAPTLDTLIFTESRAPFVHAQAAARLLGKRLGRAEAAEAWIAESDRRMASARARVAAYEGRAFAPVQMLDRRHFTYYGQGSLYADVLERLGLRNAYTGPTNPWGSRSDELASLAGLLPADLLLVAPLPPGGPELLDGPSLLTELVAVGQRRIYRLPSAWAFGELTSATRFAELVADALAPRQSGTAALPHQARDGA